MLQSSQKELIVLSKIDWSLVSAIVSSATAIIAIAAPVLTSILASKSQVRIKKMELYNERVYDALADMSNAYAALDTRDTSFGDKNIQREQYLLAMKRCSEFKASCYKLLSLVPLKSVQGKIEHLLKDIGYSTLSPLKEHDQIFYDLAKEVNDYIHSEKSKSKKPKAST